MSQLGHLRRFRHVGGMSGYPPIATIGRTSRIGRFVPPAKVARLIRSPGRHFDADRAFAVFRFTNFRLIQLHNRVNEPVLLFPLQL